MSPAFCVTGAVAGALSCTRPPCYSRLAITTTIAIRRVFLIPYSKNAQEPRSMLIMHFLSMPWANLQAFNAFQHVDTIVYVQKSMRKNIYHLPKGRRPSHESKPVLPTTLSWVLLILVVTAGALCLPKAKGWRKQQLAQWRQSGSPLALVPAPHLWLKPGCVSAHSFCAVGWFRLRSYEKQLQSLHDQGQPGGTRSDGDRTAKLQGRDPGDLTSSSAACAAKLEAAGVLPDAQGRLAGHTADAAAGIEVKLLAARRRLYDAMESSLLTEGLSLGGCCHKDWIALMSLAVLHVSLTPGMHSPAGGWACCWARKHCPAECPAPGWGCGRASAQDPRCAVHAALIDCSSVVMPAGCARLQQR